MILELTPDQKAYRQTVAAFAAERVSPMAATIDDEGTFPGALIKEAAALGLLGVTIPRESGGAGLDYVSYALALEALGRASAVRVRHRQRQQFAGRRAHRASSAPARKRIDGCAGWRRVTRSARSRCRSRLRDPMPPTSRRRRKRTMAGLS